MNGWWGSICLGWKGKREDSYGLQWVLEDIAILKAGKMYSSNLEGKRRRRLGNNEEGNFT